MPEVFIVNFISHFLQVLHVGPNKYNSNNEGDTINTKTPLIRHANNKAKSSSTAYDTFYNHVSGNS